MRHVEDLRPESRAVTRNRTCLENGFGLRDLEASEPAYQTTHAGMNACSRWYGLVTRKERWGLSWRGWLIGFAGVGLVFSVFLFQVYPFLAVTHRANTNVLVVEGWIHEYAIRAAAEEIRHKSYNRILTTGGPVEGIGHYINDYNTSASVGAELLIKNGIARELVEIVPSRVMERDRTYGSAVALRTWFREHKMAVPSINVLTEDVHARRTRLLFQEALGKNIKVGIIGVANPDYNRQQWWRYSEGVREVFSEAIAYLYAKFLFYPSESSADEEETRTVQATR
jgi:DUF218 domain